MKIPCFRVLGAASIGVGTSSCAMKVYGYKADLHHQEIIIDAYYKFMDGSGRRPDSIRDMVYNGCLPERAYYYSKYSDFSIFPKEPSFNESDYKIFPKRGASYHILGVKNENGGWDFNGDATNYARRKEESR